MQLRSPVLALVALLLLAAPAKAEITRIWLSHREPECRQLVVNWQTEQPGSSVVSYAWGDEAPREVRVDESEKLHHVGIPLELDKPCRYRVQTGEQQSAEYRFAGYSSQVLRAAIVADWQARKKLDALTRDKVQLLLTAGDNISSLHHRCGLGVKDCTRAYEELIDAYPELFRSTVFMPALGNHDREIRPRGKQPPPEPVYDVDATAFRKFFALPGDEWKWHLDVPHVGARFVALDLNHIQDQKTTWQTCHAFDKESEQFRWYQSLMTGQRPPFVVTVHNENNSHIRSREGGAWHDLFRRGTIAVTGFGYFAERAEVDGFTYYNTALGVGDRYPDSKSKFLASVASYVLLTFENGRLVVELKDLEGSVLDRREFMPASN